MFSTEALNGEASQGYTCPDRIRHHLSLPPGSRRSFLGTCGALVRGFFGAGAAAASAFKTSAGALDTSGNGTNRFRRRE